MSEFKKEVDEARPGSGRVFFVSCCGRSRPSFGSQIVFWSLMAAGILLDLWSKKAVFDWLRQRGAGGFAVINGFLQFVMAENSGAAFGMAAGQRGLLIAVSFIALAVIFAVFIFSGSEQKLVQIALGLFAAGVGGNLYDRIFNDGRVRDFIDVVYWPGRHWPAFNVADSMLCVAVALIIISGFFTEKRHPERDERRE